jgi:hypothetical protein
LAKPVTNRIGKPGRLSRTRRATSIPFIPPSPTGTPRPMRSRVTADDGRSPGLRVLARRRLPGFHPSGRLTLRSPLTVAGAAAAFGCRPSPRSLLIPSGEPSPEPCHSKFFSSTLVKAWLQPIIQMTAQDRLTLLTRRHPNGRFRRYPAVGSSDLKGWNPLISAVRTVHHRSRRDIAGAQTQKTRQTRSLAGLKFIAPTSLPPL